jgi:hypothetical protein
MGQATDAELIKTGQRERLRWDRCPAAPRWSGWSWLHGSTGDLCRTWSRSPTSHLIRDRDGIYGVAFDSGSAAWACGQDSQGGLVVQDVVSRTTMTAETNPDCRPITAPHDSPVPQAVRGGKRRRYSEDARPARWPSPWRGSRRPRELSAPRAHVFRPRHLALRRGARLVHIGPRPEFCPAKSSTISQAPPTRVELVTFGLGNRCSIL